jgi:hypothetical protein
VPRDVGVELTSRPSGQLEFRMGRDVAFGNDRVAVLGEHVARGSDEQRSVRHVARGAGRDRQLNGPTQVAFVGFSHPYPPSIVLRARTRVERA